MRIARGMILVCLTALAGFASSAEADGVGLTSKADTLPWARWQGRILFGGATPVWRAGLGGYEVAGLRPANVSVMGDYYFADALLGGNGGVRATSGLIVGLRSLGGVTAAGVDQSVDLSASPYIGVGYTGFSNRGGWAFNADLGLLAQTAGRNAVRFGHSAAGNPSADDLLRDMRLGPVVQMGVSYAF